MISLSIPDVIKINKTRYSAQKYVEYAHSTLLSIISSCAQRLLPKLLQRLLPKKNVKYEIFLLN